MLYSLEWRIVRQHPRPRLLRQPVNIRGGVDAVNHPLIIRAAGARPGSPSRGLFLNIVVHPARSRRLRPVQISGDDLKPILRMPVKIIERPAPRGVPIRKNEPMRRIIPTTKRCPVLRPRRIHLINDRQAEPIRSDTRRPQHPRRVSKRRRRSRRNLRRAVVQFNLQTIPVAPIRAKRFVEVGCLAI